jgi:hypothetical protein
MQKHESGSKISTKHNLNILSSGRRVKNSYLFHEVNGIMNSRSQKEMMSFKGVDAYQILRPFRIKLRGGDFFWIVDRFTKKTFALWNHSNIVPQSVHAISASNQCSARSIQPRSAPMIWCILWSTIFHKQQIFEILKFYRLNIQDKIK